MVPHYVFHTKTCNRQCGSSKKKQAPEVPPEYKKKKTERQKSQSATAEATPSPSAPSEDDDESPDMAAGIQSKLSDGWHEKLLRMLENELPNEGDEEIVGGSSEDPSDNHEK